MLSFNSTSCDHFGLSCMAMLPFESIIVDVKLLFGAGFLKYFCGNYFFVVVNVDQFTGPMV